MKNINLKHIYNQAYKAGGEKFFSKFKKGIDASQINYQVLKEVNWRGKEVLDVGCGIGRTAFAVARRGGKVLGIDYSLEAVRVARTHYQHSCLTFQHIDVEKIKGLFDVILVLGTLEHMDNPLNILKRLKKLLKKDGVLIATCPSFINLRGYILMSLYYLFKVPITRTDLHYITPLDMMDWAERLRMNIKWRTFDHGRSQGKEMINDLKDRLPKALGQAGMETKNIDNLIVWLKKIMVFHQQTKYNGAFGLYKLTKIT